MKTDPQSLLLFAGGVVFLVYLVVRMLLVSRASRSRSPQAMAQIAQAKARAADASRPASERAAALREAALTALTGLERPGLAASYARRAERLDPSSIETTTVLADALRKGGKYRALERMLWRRLSQEPTASPHFAYTYRELLALYEGPLARPDVASSLRKLRPE